VVWRPPGHDLLVLPAGIPSPEIERLTRPAQIESLLKGVRRSYQVAIVDTMPMLFSSDALVFARHADERLLVASAASSRVETTRQALTQLRQAGIPVRGTVLNRFVRPADRYGRYGHAYGYGSEPSTQSGREPLDREPLDGDGPNGGDRVAGREAPPRRARPHGESRAEGVGPK
jgi:Mrp family chromosome partitioning ATPase